MLETIIYGSSLILWTWCCWSIGRLIRLQQVFLITVYEVIDGNPFVLEKSDSRKFLRRQKIKHILWLYVYIFLFGTLMVIGSSIIYKTF